MTADKHPSLLALRPRLEDLGFRKRAGWIFTRDLDSTDSVIGVLGLNIASHLSPAGEVLVNPIVGVRHQEVERLYAEGHGRKYDQYRPPTYSEPLFSLAVNVGVNDLVLDQSGRDGNVIETLVDALRGDGLPFQERYANPETLIGRLAPNYLNDQRWRAIYPLLLWTIGRREEAAGATARAQEKLGGRTDLAADNDRAFFRWLAPRLEEQD